MTILGLGMDIVETKRIAESIERFGDRFACFLWRIFAGKFARLQRFDMRVDFDVGTQLLAGLGLQA